MAVFLKEKRDDMKKIIDISVYNGTIDFSKIKKSGVDGAIIKIVKKNMKLEDAFEANLKGCQDHKIPWGVYNYSYATTPAKAKTDMAKICDILDNLDKTYFKYGVWFDIEDTCQAKLSKAKIADILNAAKKVVEGRGYFFGIYTGRDFLAEHIDQEKTECKNFWLARYYKGYKELPLSHTPDPKYKPNNCKGNLYGWQFSSSCKIGEKVGTGNGNHFDITEWYIPVEEKKTETKKITKTTPGKTASKLLSRARVWLGYNEADGSHQQIIDVYNSQKPLPRSYKVKPTDSWCATFVSACAIKTDMTDIIPTECSCQKMIEKFKAKKIWQENESITPSPGYIIFYDWQDNGKGNNKGWADHVGIVEKVENGTITVIEGNYNDKVQRRKIKVNAKGIRGYGVPKYDKEGAKYTGILPTLPERGYYKKGDGMTTYFSGIHHLQIIRIQAFLNWSIKAGLDTDGEYGEKTESAVKNFQKKTGIKDVNGCWGNKCQAKAKSYVK